MSPMWSFFPIEFGRPFLRLIKEIWETKDLLCFFAVSIWMGFGSFNSFWWGLTKAPWSPFIPVGYDGHALAKMTGVIALEYILLYYMWKVYRKFQLEIPPPWREVDVKYLVSLSSPWSAFRAAHFLYSRVGKNTRHVVRATPWHFRHSLQSIQAVTALVGLVKSNGLLGLITAGAGILVMDTMWLVMQQAQAAFGWNDTDVDPTLNYRHHPRLACSALAQVLGVAVIVTLLYFGFSPPTFIAFLFPLASFGTLLLFLLHGHEVHYLGPPTAIDEGLINARSGKVTPTFCSVCQSTVFSKDTNNNIHHGSVHSLKNSAQNGCRICTPVWAQRSRIKPDFASLLNYRQPETTYSRSGNLIIKYKQDQSRPNSCVFQICALRVPDRWAGGDKGLDIRKRIATKPLPVNTGSGESLSLATKWLQHCVIHHGLCNENHEVYFRPSRLLFLGNDRVCVHTTRDMPNIVRYMTLSHCWGKSHIIRLLESLETAFRQDIPFSSLPPTFQHAIAIARQLGVLYLWIDSLCIIQDSAEDWNHEASLMGKIYKNAFCNIAAADAPDSQHGCLYPRDPKTIQPEPVRLGLKDEDEYLINDTDIYDDHILYTRAWVLQEALLARRTLDCGRGQLFWRCGEMRASEVFPGGVPTNIYRDDHPASKFKVISVENDQVILNSNILLQRLRSSKTMRMLPVAPGKGSVQRYIDAPFAFWAAIVGYYTEMKLTKDTDRIIAVAGITDIFRPFFGEHWFGMWKVFMPLELLWTTSGTYPTRPSQVRAPTWSWLSLEGAVSYAECTFKWRRDVLYTKFVRAEPVSGNCTRLHLRTPLLRAKWYGWAKKRERCFLYEVEGETRPILNWGKSTLPDVYGEVCFDFWDIKPPDEIYCLCIQLNKEFDNRHLRGIILHEVKDGVFERLGTFMDARSMIEPFLEAECIPIRDIVLI